MKDLQNESMNTSVETFFVEETKELIHDNDKLDQWKSLVGELGLSGQVAVVHDEKSPIPFLYMNNALISVFQTLCPRKELISVYDKTPIPLEILSLAALSTKENYFNKMEIWYDEQSPDPVLIGFKKSNTYREDYASWQSSSWDHYLIGRWADVKMSLDQLTEKARRLFISARKSSLSNQIKIYQRNLEDAEYDADQMFGFAMPKTDLSF